MIHWVSIWGGSSDVLASILADSMGEYSHSALNLARLWLLTYFTISKIIDTLLTPNFQNRAGSVSVSLLRIMAAYTSFLNVSNQWPLRLTMMQRQKVLMLHWRSFSEWVRVSLASLLVIHVACTWLMNVSIQLPLKLRKMGNQKSFIFHSISFSGWGRESLPPVFDYKGGQYIKKRQWGTD